MGGQHVGSKNQGCICNLLHCQFLPFPLVPLLLIIYFSMHISLRSGEFEFSHVIKSVFGVV